MQCDFGHCGHGGNFIQFFKYRMSFVQKRNRGGHAWPNQPTVNSLLISYVFLYYLLHFGIMFLTMSMLFKQRVPDAVTTRRHSGLGKAMLFAQRLAVCPML